MVARDWHSGPTEPFRQLLADMVLWLSLVILFLAFRIVLFWLFRAELVPPPSTSSFLRCFESGLRFDTCAATWAVLPSLILTLAGFFQPLRIWHQRVRSVLIVMVLSLCAIAFITDIGYFGEYDTQFDHWIFGLIHDDLRAILITIWKTYPIILLLLFGGISVALSSWALRKLCGAAASADVPAFVGAGWTRAATVVLVGIWTLMGLRVWPGNYLVDLKNAGATGHAFLNKIVLNPFFALRYAIWQERNLLKATGLRTILPGGDVRGAAAAVFPEATNTSTLDDCTKQVALGGTNPPPSDVFIVVMESYDAWAMQPEYAALHLTDRLKAIGREGIHLQAFIPSGYGTIESLGVIITGLPDARVLVNYQPVVREGLPTSAAGIFKRLGYRTRFFYGGFLSWERIGEFCREQGFEDVYGGDQMPRRSKGNEWGVDDEDLFRFVLEHTGAEPTFNLIMSTSYHPPYSVDLEKKGFDLETWKTNPMCAGLSETQLRIQGHLWYADKCVGEFVSEAEHKLERPLFAITGDHYSRKKFVSVRPMQPLYDQLAVPLVIYGPKALERVGRPANLAGSHLDIVPTIVNLAAPSGFVYHSFGRDLFAESKPQIGYGCNAVIGPNFILRVHEPTHVEDLHGEPAAGVNGEELALHYRELSALGWWRAVKGNQWPVDKLASAPKGN